MKIACLCPVLQLGLPELGYQMIQLWCSHPDTRGPGRVLRSWILPVWKPGRGGRGRSTYFWSGNTPNRHWTCKWLSSVRFSSPILTSFWAVFGCWRTFRTSAWRQWSTASGIHAFALLWANLRYLFQLSRPEPARALCRTVEGLFLTDSQHLGVLICARIFLQTNDPTHGVWISLRLPVQLASVFLGVVQVSTLLHRCPFATLGWRVWELWWISMHTAPLRPWTTKGTRTYFSSEHPPTR